MDNPNRFPNLDQPIIRDRTRMRFPPADDSPDDMDCAERLIRRSHPLADLATPVSPLPEDQGQAPWNHVSWPWASGDRGGTARQVGWLGDASAPDSEPPASPAHAPQATPADPAAN